MKQFPHYPLPWKTIVPSLGAVLCAPHLRCRRSFCEDAQQWTAGLCPPLCVYGHEHIPLHGPFLLTVNHYFRPGFHAWWLPLTISAVVPVEIHWTMTAAWTYRDALRRHTLTPATHWLFRRIAQVYGFTTMPPMPPDPRDMDARTLAVRRVLAYTRETSRPAIGLAPEGGDAPGGRLQPLPPGAGRFMLHLARLGLDVVPVGGFEQEGAFCLRFGTAFRLDVPSDLAADERDRQASRMVVQHIAAQLPAYLRGEFEEVPDGRDELIISTGSAETG